MFEIRKVYIRRTYKFISALLSLLLCGLILLNGFSTGEFANHRLKLTDKAGISSKEIEHFALQVDEIFEEEETERVSAFSFEVLPLIAGLVLSLLAIWITRKLIIQPVSVYDSYSTVPIYIWVENYRL